ncbi:MAG TPA: alpha/beta fold hydrolase [Acidimicrobiia bacterium]|nr:alpha/beta fold hydrolase [Acidimicrobiia bacterium]
MSTDSLSYRSTGNGPLAVFLHGFPMDHRLWDQVVAHLGGLRRCVAVDLPGCGASSMDGASSIDEIADRVASLIAELGEAADVVGLSMGGYVQLALYERHPQTVRSLALMDTRSEADTEEGRAGRMALIQEVEASGVGGLADRLAEGLPSAAAAPWVKRRIRTMAEDSPRSGVAAALHAMAYRPDRTALLGSIAVPVLVLVGSEDELTPPEGARRMAGAVPGASFVEVPGAGHVPPLERPSAVVEALREFWKAGGSSGL